MPDFRYYHPIEVRYGDLDPQGHVNNAKYLTYLEQGRVGYLQHLGLWNGGSFLDLGIILADVHVTFLAPIRLGDPVRVGVRVSRLGNKSLAMEYSVLQADTGQELATGSTILVAYDYRLEKTVPVPPTWRQAMSEFEEMIES